MRDYFKSPFAISLIAIIISVASLGVLVYAQHQNASTDCKTKGMHHIVTIKDGKPTPNDTKASVCDTLTIRNADSQTRLIGFGSHDHHAMYNGVDERLLKKDQSFTITLASHKSIGFHDHYDHDAEGRITLR